MVPEKNGRGWAGDRVPDTERPVVADIKDRGHVLAAVHALVSREGRCLFKGAFPNVVLPIYSGRNVLSSISKT
jgi:hypothetical protein